MTTDRITKHHTGSFHIIWLYY